jgi:bisphosphoglycerate-dependent phosphoglycerate mutase
MYCVLHFQGNAITVTGAALEEPILIQAEGNVVRLMFTGIEGTNNADMQMRQIFTTACGTPSMYSTHNISTFVFRFY